MKQLSFLALILAGLLFPLTAMAQNSKTEQNNSFSAEQIYLNNEAYDATAAGDFDKAEILYKALLKLGEFNIVWMNLGRTYLSENKCIEARDAFAHVSTSPKIADIPAETIAAKTKDYIKELNAKCSSSVILNCKPADMLVSIDGGQEMRCTDKAIYVVPGQHSIFGRTDYGFNTAGASTFEGQTANVDIEVINYEQFVIDAGVSKENLEAQSRLFKALGYSFIGVGAGVLGGGIGITLYFWQDYKEKYRMNERNEGNVSSDNLRNIKKENEKRMAGGYVMSAIGGAMLIAGVALVIVDAKKIRPQIEKLASYQTASFELSPVFSTDFNGLMLSGRF